MAAVAALKRRKFDLAVTDLKMPGMDGVATLEALRSLDPDIEVIVATGYASVETAVACMKRGAYDYIQKPYDLTELKLLLERASQKSHLQSVVALYEASRALMSTLNHSDLVQLVVTLAQRVLRADNIGLLLQNRDGEGFTIHRLKEEAHPWDPLLLELAQRVTQEGAPLRLPAPSILMIPSTGRGAAGRSTEYGSALAYPLVARSRSLGVLIALRHSKSPEFSPSELQKGTVFASQLAVSLENARLYDELAQKVSELVRTREQLVHAEKLALAGQLAGAVAHEVNNPLAFVRSNLNALRDYSSIVGGLWLAAKSAATYLRAQGSAAAQQHAGELSTAGGSEERTEHLIQEIVEVIDETLEGVKRIAELVAGFARLAESKGEVSPERVDVNEVIQECIDTLARPNEQHTGKIGFEARPCMALVSREDLRSALLNLMAFLCAPERKRVAGNGMLTLRTTSVGGTPTVILTDETLVLSEEERQRIFDPRVEVDSGGRTMRLNIALALTYQMLRRNGAEVTTTIEDHYGITFTIRLTPLPS
jgi:CheY-like chemotaxis protein